MAERPKQHTSSAEREALLEELGRQGEKVIDAQVRASEEGDEKSKQVLAVALLVIAGGAASAQLVVTNDSDADMTFLVLLVGALACAGASFWHVARGYIGTGEQAVKFRIGWDTKELAQIAKNTHYSYAEVLEAGAEAVDAWASHNARLLTRLVTQRIAGVVWLFGAGMLLGLAFLYALVRF